MRPRGLTQNEAIAFPIFESEDLELQRGDVGGVELCLQRGMCQAAHVLIFIYNIYIYIYMYTMHF